MKKVNSWVVFIFMFTMTTTAKAMPDTSENLKSLEDSALALVYGQAGLVQTAMDPHRLNEHQLMEVLNHWAEKEVRGDLKQLTSMFYVNEQGQTVLQINREVVSIGVLEFRLNFDGLSELGRQIADQLTLK